MWRWAFWMSGYTARMPFDGQFTVQHRDYHEPVHGFQGGGDNQLVAVADPGAGHRVPGHPNLVGDGNVFDQALSGALAVFGRPEEKGW